MADACDLHADCTLPLSHEFTCEPLVWAVDHWSIPMPEQPWAEIADGLWQGGSHRQPYREEFDAVLTLYHRAPRPEAGIKHKEVYLRDMNCMPEAWALEEAVAWARMHWMTGSRVLVRCQAGLNRSGLIVARVLIDAGGAPDEIIHLIRQRRSPYALCNRTFETYLRSLG